MHQNCKSSVQCCGRPVTLTRLIFPRGKKNENLTAINHQLAKTNKQALPSIYPSITLHSTRLLPLNIFCGSHTQHPTLILGSSKTPEPHLDAPKLALDTHSEAKSERSSGEKAEETKYIYMLVYYALQLASLSQLVLPCPSVDHVWLFNAMRCGSWKQCWLGNLEMPCLSFTC